MDRCRDARSPSRARPAEGSGPGSDRTEDAKCIGRRAGSTEAGVRERLGLRLGRRGNGVHHGGVRQRGGYEDHDVDRPRPCTDAAGGSRRSSSRSDALGPDGSDHLDSPFASTSGPAQLRSGHHPHPRAAQPDSRRDGSQVRSGIATRIAGGDLGVHDPSPCTQPPAEGTARYGPQPIGEAADEQRPSPVSVAMSEKLEIQAAEAELGAIGHHRTMAQKGSSAGPDRSGLLECQRERRMALWDSSSI